LCIVDPPGRCFEKTFTHRGARQDDEEDEGSDGAGAEDAHWGASPLGRYLTDGGHTAAEILAAYYRTIANADGDTAATLLANHFLKEPNRFVDFVVKVCFDCFSGGCGRGLYLPH